MTPECTELEKSTATPFPGPPMTEWELRFINLSNSCFSALHLSDKNEDFPFFYSSDGLKRALEKRINSGGNLICSEVW